jgi:hypothetical protein
MRWRGRLVVLGVMAVVAVVSATAWATSAAHAAGPRRVRLVVPGHPVRAGQNVDIAVVGLSPRRLMVSTCSLLQRRVSGRWVSITTTNGIPLHCPLSVGAPADTTRPVVHVSVTLWADLVPGRYRIVMAYKVISPHWTTVNFRHHHPLTAELKVLRFAPGPASHLSEKRIKRIALNAAKGGHPTLIQHAEGTRFEANVLAGGDQIPDWHWAYLIAIKGHFKFNPEGSGGTYPPDRGEGLSPDTAGKQTATHTYTVITLVLDARTGRTEDFGISNGYPDIAKLGPVTTDYRRQG